MDEQHKQRMKVSWSKGLEYFQSFFTLLADARDEVGNRELPNWCFDELGIGFDRVTQIAKCLREDDRMRVQQELAQARAADRERRATERQERERAREEERARRQRERDERAAEQRRERRRESDRRYRQRRRISDRSAQLEAYVASVPPPTNNRFADLSSSELVRGIKNAIRKRDASRAEWIDASVELAGLLVQARQVAGENDTQFGRWLSDHDIIIEKNDRMALINLGANLTAMRQVLERSGRSSYQHIWGEIRNRLPAIVAA